MSLDAALAAASAAASGTCYTRGAWSTFRCGRGPLASRDPMPHTDAAHSVASLLTVAMLGVVAADAARAQNSAVIPPQFASVEAPGLEQEPFAYNRIRFVQYTDRSLLTAVPANASIHRIAYRRDTNGYTESPMSRTGRTSPNPVWQVRLGNTDQSAQNPSYLFPTAAAAGWTLVYLPKVTSFPSETMPAMGPAPFNIQFVFDVPFLYGGGNLGVDHQAYESNGNTFTYFVDGLNPVAANTGTVGLIGPTTVGCPTGENRAGGFAPNPGDTLRIYLFGGPASSFALTGLGFGSTSWGGNPLPLDLTGYGMPGCFAYVDFITTVMRPTSAGGFAEYTLPIPAQASYQNMTLLAQWIALDDRVNPTFPLTTSDGIALTLGSQVGGTPLPMSVVSATGNLAAANNGFVGLGRGAVYQLHW